MKTTRVPITLQQAVMKSLREKLQLASQKLAVSFPEPAVSYQQRGTIAGSARLQSWEIRINPVLLIENGLPFIEQVVPHELAHLLVYRHFGRVPPHGTQWKWMMENVLLVSASRTHSFDTKTVQSKTFAYQCACQQHQLTLRRHNRILRRGCEYRCRVCGEPLQPLHSSADKNK